MSAPDLVGAHDRRRHDGVLVIGLALALLLVGGGVAALVLKHRDEQADAKARRALQQAAVAVTAVGVATPADHRIAVVLSVRSGTSAKVVAASVTGDGWQAVHDKGVALVRQVDCLTAPPPPTAAEAVLELHGQKRTFQLLTALDLTDVLDRAGKEACGDVDARRALTLKASGATRVPGGLQLGLSVTNRSAHPVTLTAISVGRLHLRTARKLPVVVAPHASFSTVVVLDARGCGKPQPVVGVNVDGQGGQAFLTVASAYLPQLAAAILQEHCHR